MTSLWKVGIRALNACNILLEYRLFECNYVTLKSHKDKERILVSVDSNVL